MDNYRGIGESDKLLAEANDLRWQSERELVTACKRIVELEAENASLRARLSEVDSWKPMSELPNDYTETISVRHIWRPLKEVK